jgi:membrane fusion protein, heavy metal efflux system
MAGVAFAALGVAMIGFGTVHPVAGQTTPTATATPAASADSFKPTEAQLKSLRIASVSLVTFRSDSVTEGNIAIDDDLSTPVYSPYSGHVVQLIAKLGDQVERGAPLFEVEATEFVQAANTLITAVGAAKTAQSQLKQAEVNEKRAHDLYLANGGALKDWQQSRTDLAAAQNAIRSADIALAAARNQLRILGKSEADIDALEAAPTQQLDPVATVYAPISGTITQRQVARGQNIQSISAGASTPVYTIGDLSTIWLIANVREEDAPMMRVGAPVTVRVTAFPSRVFKAKISWVAASLDPNTHRLPVRADVENADGALKPMMFANFSITTGQDATAPAVPQTAVVYEGDTVRVWLVKDDGTLVIREVEIGRIEDGMVEILGGLAPGDKIVTSGALFIDRAAATD